MVTYLNNGSPHYEGISFTDKTELLNILLTNLPTEGWEIILDDIAGSDLLVVKGTSVNSHPCFIRFSVTGNTLEIRGDLTGDNILVSPPLGIDFEDGEDNQFWLTFDADSGALAIKNSRLYVGGMTFGFYDRINTNDQNAWHIGKLNNRLLDAYVARSAFDNLEWVQIGSRFLDADQFGNTNFNGPIQGLIDLVAVKVPFVDFFNTNVRNAGYSGFRGALDLGTGKPVVSGRFYIEGRLAAGDYVADTENSLPPGLYFRGFVKHVINGFGGSVMGRRETDSLGRVWLSSGPDDLGWQGLQIDLVASTFTELPAVIRSGIVFVEGDNYRTELSNVITGSGWTKISETNTRSLFEATHTDGSSKFYLISRINDDGNQIILRGSFDVEETVLSPELVIPFTPNTSNIIYEAFNSQSGAMCIRDGSTQDFIGVWFGFFKHPIARMGIGFTTNDLFMSYVYDPILQRWRSLNEGFVYDYANFSSFPTIGFDRLTVSEHPARFFDNQQNDQNSARFAYNGRINAYTNNAQLSFFSVFEGYSSLLSYGLLPSGENVGVPFNYLGEIEFLATGLASLTQGTVVTSDTGIQYLSTGDKQWQGMRISN